MFLIKLITAIVFLFVAIPGLVAGILYGITLRGFYSGTKLIDKTDDWYTQRP